MELNAEEQNGNIILSSEDKKHTVMNLLKRYLWDADAEAGYDQGHPYVGGSKLVFSADDPVDAIDDAADAAKKDLEAFKDQF